MKYLINEVYSSIQGEGALVGTLMTILRFQGCEVGCPFCDTKQTWHKDEKLRAKSLAKANSIKGAYVEMSAEELGDALDGLPARWLMITGGEPAQYDLNPLAHELRRRGYKLALETSGTELRALETTVFDWVCVSPKLEQKKVFMSDSLRYADEIKCVVTSERDIEAYETLLIGAALKRNVVRSLQPVTIRKDKQEQIDKDALALCLRHIEETGGKWRLSIQTHKLLGLM